VSRRRTKYIDPQTMSYVMRDGEWVMDETGWSQLYWAVMTKLGTVPADDALGCRLWNRTKMAGNMAATAKKDMEDAAQWVIDEGLVDTFEVVYCRVNGSNPNRLDYGWHWTADGNDHYWDRNLTIGTE